MDTTPGSKTVLSALRKAETLKERSGLAILCGKILRSFAHGWKILGDVLLEESCPKDVTGVDGFHCPYIMNIELRLHFRAINTLCARCQAS